MTHRGCTARRRARWAIRAAEFHDFLWSIRLAWARAEGAAARGAHDEVERWSAEALARTAAARPKYEVAALVTRARSRTERGRRADAR